MVIQARESEYTHPGLSGQKREHRLKNSDEALVDAVVEAVQAGHKARADISAYCGLAGPKAVRVIGLAIQARRITMRGRDGRSSPLYELAGRPAEVVCEVVA